MIRAACLGPFFAVLLACHSGARSGAPSSPAEPDLRVVYQKTGGFLPFNDTLVVQGDGVLAYTDRNHTVHNGRVAPGELNRLRRLIESNEFQEAAPQYKTERGADLVTHSIDARLGGKEKRVLVMTSTEHPRTLDEIITELDRLAALTR